jgi:Ca2+/Na+ antiporter
MSDGAWIVFLVVFTLVVIIWRQKYRRFDGQAIGPLKRIVHVNRDAFIMWTLVVLPMSALHWGLPLLQASYQMWLMVLWTFGSLTFVFIVDRRLHRKRQEMENNTKHNTNLP